MNSSRWLAIPVALLFVAAGIGFGVQRHTPAAPAPAAVSELFRQSLATPQGEKQALSQWQGKTVLLNFWATWCAPCVQEMPELSTLQAELGGPTRQIIGIGIDSPSNIREFSEKLRVSYPLYVGGTGASELSRQFGNKEGGLPFTVLIGADGQVRKTYLGRLDIAQVRRDLAGL